VSENWKHNQSALPITPKSGMDVRIAHILFVKIGVNDNYARATYCRRSCLEHLDQVWDVLYNCCSHAPFVGIPNRRPSWPTRICAIISYNSCRCFKFCVKPVPQQQHKFEPSLYKVLFRMVVTSLHLDLFPPCSGLGKCLV